MHRRAVDRALFLLTPILALPAVAAAPLDTGLAAPARLACPPVVLPSFAFAPFLLGHCTPPPQSVIRSRKRPPASWPATQWICAWKSPYLGTLSRTSSPTTSGSPARRRKPPIDKSRTSTDRKSVV